MFYWNFEWCPNNRRDNFTTHTWYQTLASLPGLPLFFSSVCIHNMQELNRRRVLKQGRPGDKATKYNTTI